MPKKKPESQSIFVVDIHVDFFDPKKSRMELQSIPVLRICQTYVEVERTNATKFRARIPIDECAWYPEDAIRTARIIVESKERDARLHRKMFEAMLKKINE